MWSFVVVVVVVVVVAVGIGAWGVYCCLLLLVVAWGKSGGAAFVFANILCKVRACLFQKADKLSI